MLARDYTIFYLSFSKVSANTLQLLNLPIPLKQYAADSAFTNHSVLMVYMTYTQWAERLVGGRIYEGICTIEEKLCVPNLLIHYG